MTQSYFPFDSGAGGNVTEAQWWMMAQHWLSTGIIKTMLNEMQSYADSTGMQVKVKSGQAWIKGHFFQSDAEENLPIAAADPANARIDRVIIRNDWVTNTIQLAVLQGTPAATPVAPALTQIMGTRWEISLAQVRVNAAITTITAGNITDERIYALRLNDFISVNGQLNVPSQGLAKVYNNANQTINGTTGTHSKMTLAAVESDRQSEFASNKFTAKETGTYLVRIYMTTSTSPTGFMFSRLYKNGSSFGPVGVTVGNQYAEGSIILTMNAGDYLEFYAEASNGGTALTVTSGNYIVWLYKLS